MPFTPYGQLGTGRPILVGAEGPQGPQGPDGPTGPVGDYVNHYRGVWTAGTAYASGDIVTYAGSSWLALAPSTGIAPAEGAAWTLTAAGGTGQVNTVNSKAPASGNVTLTASDVGAVAASTLGVPNGVATLGSDGTLPTSQIPALSLVTATPVASQAAMLALGNVQPGDIAVRTDGAGTFILTALPASTLGNWLLLNAPTDKVLSVNGQTGTVVLGPADVSALAIANNLSDLNNPATARTNLGLGTAATKAAGAAAGNVPVLNGSALVDPASLGSGTRDGTRYLRDDGTWAATAAGGGSTFLGSAIRTATGLVNYAIPVNGGSADVDATNLSVTFTAPSSGAVVVMLSGVTTSTTTSTSVIYWSVRSGSTNIPGTEQSIYAGTNAVQARYGYRTRITGLTPGATYTYKWAARATLSAAGLYYGGSSAEFSTSTANYGPATMEVWSA